MKSSETTTPATIREVTRWLPSRGGGASSGGSGRVCGGTFADGGPFVVAAVDGATEGAEPAEAGASAASDGGSTGPDPSSIFQSGLRNFRNSHGGRSPISTVPA